MEFQIVKCNQWGAKRVFMIKVSLLNIAILVKLSNVMLSIQRYFNVNSMLQNLSTILILVPIFSKD